LYYLHPRRLLIDVLGLKAVHAAARMDDDTAVAALREAVALSQPGRLIRPLADLGPGLVRILNRLDLDPEGLSFVGSILAAIRGPDVRESIPRESQPLINPLSLRGFEILDLLAGGLSDREIAEKLYISPGTVKRHAHNIYEKLAVSGRRAAVAKARGLGLLQTS